MNINLKNINKIVSVIIISLFLTTLFSSCKKDSSNPADGGNGGGGGNYTVTLNGDGWTNKSVTTSVSTSTYSISGQFTAINIICSDDIKLLCYTPGNQTGTFNFENGQGSAQDIGITLSSGTGQNVKWYFGGDNSGTVTISSYGAVGAKVSGSFTGTLTNPLTQAEITVSGTFSATRTVDLP
jgi:hypothetical protein